MKKHILVVALLHAWVLTSCSSSTPKETPTEQDIPTMENTHTSQNSLDWAGTYEGTLPCADCEGIHTRLELNADLSYTLTEHYLGTSESKNTFSENGKFRWNKAGNTVELNQVDNRKYKVQESKIVHLNADGEEITGSLAEMYVLEKQ